MPNLKKTHEENRRSVCIGCLGKASLDVLSPEIRRLVTVHFYPDFEAKESYLPSGICNTCYTKLLSQGRSYQRSLPKPVRYHDLAQSIRNMPITTRKSAGFDCTCEICRIGSSKQKVITSPFAPSKAIEKADVKKGRPSLDSKPEKDLPCCQKCLTTLGKGIDHICNKSIRHKNLLDRMSPRGLEQLATEAIKKKAQSDPNENTLTLSSKNGKPIKVTPGSQNEIKKLPNEVYMAIKTRLNLSERKICALPSILGDFGFKSEPNLKKISKEKGEILAEYFEIEKLTFTVNDPNSKNEKGKKKALVPQEREVVLCKDVAQLVTFILNERDQNADDVDLKVGIDGGQSFFKVCLTMQKDEQEAIKKTRYSLKQGGVKKLIILGIVEDIPENYDNAKIVFEALNLTLLDFCLSSDLKLINIICGIQSHSAKYPCAWCIATSPYDKPAPLRTLGDIIMLVEQYTSAGSVKKNAKKFYNCINKPLIKGNLKDLILKLIPLPELHIFLGGTNHIFDNANDRCEEDEAYDWAFQNGIVREDYHGGQLNGPNCSKLLRNLDSLELVLPPHLKKFIKALKLLDLVKKGCFSMNLEPDYKERVMNFKEAYLELEISVTPKVHMIFDHVIPFCELKEKGLGYYSEQASESVHYDFKTTWSNYSRKMNDPKYGEKLLSAVVNYNSHHI